jgi:septal ring factor EnvC (AmiA/AmiB activator)
MKKKIISILFLTCINTFAQKETLTNNDWTKELQPVNTSIQYLQTENSKLKAEINLLKKQLITINKNIVCLQKQTQNNSTVIEQTTNELGIKIKETGDKTEGKITEVSESLSKNSLYGIIGVLSAILLSGLLYWLLSKRQQTDKTDFIDQLSKTKSSIEESLVKEFGKQTELLETQLQLIEEQAKNQTSKSSNQEIDHSLALKLCDQINQMENNINKMDQDVKGIKSLRKSIGNLKDNLAANKYEMPELIGKTFNQGMNLIVVNTIPDDNLNKGDEIITKIIKPQINYQGKMIQSAQVEVSVG